MVTYDGFDLSEYALINNIGRSLTPPQEVITSEGRNKVYYVRKEYSPRTFPVDITLYENKRIDYVKLKRFLADKLSKDEPRPLIFHDEPDKYYMAILTGETAIDDLLNAGTATLHFFCPDPIAFGRERVFDITDSPIIYNMGTFPATGQIDIKITEPVKSLKVTLLNTGEFIQIIDNLKAGDNIHIDCDIEYASKNNNSIMNKIVIASDFFQLPTGKFKISVSTGTATLKFKERWK